MIRPKADRRSGYGWISIALHWLAAAAILVLLFLGDSISAGGQEARGLHTTLAACVWLALALRVGWRLVQGHPERMATQGKISYLAGKAVHFILLAAISLMLVSGPLAGWASGQGIDIFNLALPGASPAQPALYQAAHQLHLVGAATLLVATIAHVAGVLKHMLIDRDHTLDRMMVPHFNANQNSQ